MIARALRLAFALVLACSIAQGVARAQAPAPSSSQAKQSTSGRGPDGLPGVRDLALVDGFGQGAKLASTVGYGYTEAVENVGDKHHRVLLLGGASYALLDTIGFGASFSGHYDSHDGGGSDGDSSFALTTRLHGRLRYPLTPQLSIGGELAVRFPPASSGDGLKAISPELRALGTWAGLAPGLVLGMQLGFRLDRSGEGVRDAARLSAADRVALGASSSSALLVGLGGTYNVAPRHRILGEITWDALVGASAPTLPHAPLRLLGGWRFDLTEALALDAFLSVSPSARPSLAGGRPLVPIEPRVVLGVGISAGLGAAPEKHCVITGRVVDERGAPLAQTRVTVTGPRATSITTDATGRFTFEGTLKSQLTIVAQREHYMPARRDLLLQTETLALGDLQLVHGRGAVRGRVVGPELLPKASVVVSVFDSPTGSTSGEEALSEAISADDGTFSLEALPAGPLYLVASALGFRDAQVEVQVPVEGELQVELKLSEALPEGQIRGTIRGAGGAQLAAMIRVEPLGLAITAARDGSFSLDVAPGSYQLLVTAPGYEPQQRNVEVERDGVTVVLVDLLRQP